MNELLANKESSINSRSEAREYNIVWKVLAGIAIIFTIYSFWLKKSSSVTANQARELDLTNKLELCEASLQASQFEAAGNFMTAVTFIRSELLGPAERQEVREKIIQPYVDYRNDDGEVVVAVAVTVPVTLGSSFEILAIKQDGSSESFKYGVHGQVIEYWLPTCPQNKPCGFSESFIQKYPEIVKKF